MVERKGGNGGAKVRPISSAPSYKFKRVEWPVEKIRALISKHAGSSSEKRELYQLEQHAMCLLEAMHRPPPGAPTTSIPRKLALTLIAGHRSLASATLQASDEFLKAYFNDLKYNRRSTELYNAASLLKSREKANVVFSQDVFDAMISVVKERRKQILGEQIGTYNRNIFELYNKALEQLQSITPE